MQIYEIKTMGKGQNLGEKQSLISKDEEKNKTHQSERTKGRTIKMNGLKKSRGFCCVVVGCAFAAFGAMCVRKLDGLVPDIEVCLSFRNSVSWSKTNIIFLFMLPPLCRRERSKKHTENDAGDSLCNREIHGVFCREWSVIVKIVFHFHWNLALDILITNHLCKLWFWLFH